MIYEQALANFRNDVNRCFSPDLSSRGSRNSRRVSQLQVRRGGGRSQGERQGRGHGRGGRLG